MKRYLNMFHDMILTSLVLIADDSVCVKSFVELAALYTKSHGNDFFFLYIVSYIYNQLNKKIYYY